MAKIDIHKAVPLTHSQLTDMWRRQDAADVRTLIVEIGRLQRVLCEADDLFKLIRAEWNGAKMGHMFAMHRLRLLLREEVTSISWDKAKDQDGVDLASNSDLSFPPAVDPK